jgi:hypothetical protein
MTPNLFHALLQELIDENPFAIRAALRILRIEFTEDVPTLAVTCEAKPRLLVNLGFLASHAKSEQHVKAVVCHEFLHVLLRHTEGRQPLTPARHLAFDAVINAIIHRQFGNGYSSMMADYYANAKGLQKLLRPMTTAEQCWVQSKSDKSPPWAIAWEALYQGRLIADDIESLAETLSGFVLKGQAGKGGGGPFTLAAGSIDVSDLLGNHEDLGKEAEGELAKALEGALKQMNGHGIWRSPRDRGIGGPLADTLFAADDKPMRRWEARTLAVIKRYITPDRQSRAHREECGATASPCCRRPTGVPSCARSGRLSCPRLRGRACASNATAPRRCISTSADRWMRKCHASSACSTAWAGTSVVRSGPSATKWRRPRSSRAT